MLKGRLTVLTMDAKGPVACLDKTRGALDKMTVWLITLKILRLFSFSVFFSPLVHEVTYITPLVSSQQEWKVVTVITVAYISVTPWLAAADIWETRAKINLFNTKIWLFIPALSSKIPYILYLSNASGQNTKIMGKIQKSLSNCSNFPVKRCIYDVS